MRLRQQGETERGI
jgi:hypothetical protein